MSRGRFEKTVPTRRLSTKLVIVLLLICLLVIVLLYTCIQSPPVQESLSESETTMEKNPDSIAIPGYELLELKADSKEQMLSLPNPPQNMCYFEITLYLEDGTLLWKSEMIEPGKTSKPMVLTKNLKKGTYPNAVLRYACYRMDEELSPLNGAETKVTLWVK